MVTQINLEPAGKKIRMPGGLREAGTLDPKKPIAFVKNPDGSTSTVRTIGIGTDRGETVIPTVSRDGRIMTNPEAIKQYKESGENFGTFIDRKSAAAYADELHNTQSGLVPENIRGGTMAGVNDINIENLMALDTLKRLGSMVTDGLRGLNQPPQTVAPNVYGQQPQPAQAVAPAAPTVSAKYPRGGGLPPGISAANVATKPSFGTSTISDVGITQTMKGGLRRTANGAGTTYEQGTPGQDGYGRMVVTPAGTPMSAEESQFRAPVGTGGGMRATGRMIQATSPDYSFLRPANNGQAPIDFNSMSRPERRFALRNAQLSQEQQQQDNTYDLGLRTIAASRDNAQVREQETPAQLGLRQAQTREAGARSALLTEQAKIAGNEKFITTFEETPYKDPATGLTEMRRTPILVNPANPKEVIRPGQPAVKAPTETDFMAALDANPARRKAYNGLSPEKQAALRDKYIQSGAM